MEKANKNQSTIGTVDLKMTSVMVATGDIKFQFLSNTQLLTYKRHKAPLLAANLHFIRPFALLSNTRISDGIRSLTNYCVFSK